MTGPLFEPPPQIGTQNEDGSVVLSKDEWDQLISWLERLTQFVAQEYD